MTIREIVVYVLGMVLTFASYLSSISTDFFFLLRSNPAMVPFASVGLAFLAFLIVDRLACGFRDTNNLSRFQEFIRRAFGGIPHYDLAYQFSSCDDAMDYLATKIPLAKAVFNTKISPDVVPPGRAVAAKYDKAIRQGLKKGLHYRDLVSSGFTGEALNLATFAQNTPGAYSYKIINPNTSCFLNFIVLDYSVEPDEVVIGWATSSHSGMEQKAFIIRDKRVVAYFKDYHAALST